MSGFQPANLIFDLGVQGRNAAKQDLDKEASPVDEAMEE